jgi:hypothetical protein
MEVDNVVAFKSVSSYNTNNSYSEYTPRDKDAASGRVVLI